MQMKTFTRQPSVLRGIHRAPKASATRSFHASTPNRTVFDSIIPFTHDIFQAIHSVTGLPWGLTIPLASVLAKLAISVPLQVASLRSVQRQKELSPLLFTWQNKFRYDLLKEEKKTGIRKGGEEATKQVALQLTGKRDEIYKRHRIYPRLKYAPLLQLPIWLCFMDTLRCMCGLESRFPTTTETLVHQEPGFETGGILWFENLLADDSTLSVATGIAMLYITAGSTAIKDFMSDNQDQNKRPKRSYVQERLSEFMIMYALMIPIVAIIEHIPSALMLYWFSGSLFAIIQRPLMERMLKMPPVPQPAKRKEVVMK